MTDNTQEIIKTLILIMGLVLQNQREIMKQLNERKLEVQIQKTVEVESELMELTKRWFFG